MSHEWPKANFIEANGKIIGLLPLENTLHVFTEHGTFPIYSNEVPKSPDQPLHWKARLRFWFWRTLFKAKAVL